MRLEYAVKITICYCKWNLERVIIAQRAMLMCWMFAISRSVVVLVVSLLSCIIPLALCFKVLIDVVLY